MVAGDRPPAGRHDGGDAGRTPPGVGAPRARRPASWPCSAPRPGWRDRSPRRGGCGRWPTAPSIRGNRVSASRTASRNCSAARPGWEFVPWAADGESGYWEFMPSERGKSGHAIPTTVMNTDRHPGWIDVLPAHTGRDAGPDRDRRAGRAAVSSRGVRSRSLSTSPRHRPQGGAARPATFHAWKTRTNPGCAASSATSSAVAG